MSSLLSKDRIYRHELVTCGRMGCWILRVWTCDLVEIMVWLQGEIHQDLVVDLISLWGRSLSPKNRNFRELIYICFQDALDSISTDAQFERGHGKATRLFLERRNTSGGGYSTVDLVQHGNSGNTYALKSVSKGTLAELQCPTLHSGCACRVSMAGPRLHLANPDEDGHCQWERCLVHDQLPLHHQTFCFLVLNFLEGTLWKLTCLLLWLRHGLHMLQ